MARRVKKHSGERDPVSRAGLSWLQKGPGLSLGGGRRGSGTQNGGLPLSPPLTRAFLHSPPHTFPLLPFSSSLFWAVISPFFLEGRGRGKAPSATPYHLLSAGRPYQLPRALTPMEPCSSSANGPQASLQCWLLTLPSLTSVKHTATYLIKAVPGL